MKVKELIKNLKAIEKEFGNIEIYTSADEEGNCFGDLAENYSLQIQELKDEKDALIIFPFNTYLEEDIFKI